MSEDLQANLNTYKVQLQQVEASLTNDPDNEDLVKLQSDLQEVIDLTLELLKQNVKTSKSDHSTGGSAANLYDDDGHAQAAVGNPVDSEPSTINLEAPAHDWKIGDNCLALWSDDGGHYPAVIEEFLDDGTCTVTFQSYGNTEITQVHLLKPLEERTTTETGEGAASNKPKSKKDLIAQQREYKRKKTQKKQQRQKQIAEERETEKNKWLNFNSKTFSKTSKGKVKKSIFATTDKVQGRVGVGTCGTSGQPMTNYIHQEKWKKS